MSPAGELIIGVCMAIGLIGTVIPILPGLLLMWAAGLSWVILDGGGLARWSLFAVMTVLVIAGHVMGIKIPVQRVTTAQPSRGTLIVASVLGLIGFFVIPVLGLPIGFISGIFIWNLIQTREFHRALRITWATTKSFGLVVLIHLLCGIGIAFLWLLGLVLV